MRPGAPSRTALVVAGGVVFAAGEPGMRGGVAPDAVEWTRSMLRACTGGRRLLRWIDRRPGRTAIRLLERCTFPGIVRHWVCRKQWLEREWAAAVADGFDTLVVLGSGFDTLSLRVARASDGRIRTIDVDHPGTLRVRCNAVGNEVGSSHRFVEHDLSGPGLAASLSPALPPTASVFFLIEGVLMYLAPERVLSLFQEIAKLHAHRVRVAFTFMDATGGRPPAFLPRSRLIDVWLHLRGEPFLSGCDRSSLSHGPLQHRFSLIRLSEVPGREHEDTNGTVLRGECAAIADRT